MRQRVLALDVGEQRIGVAVSDPLSITAQGLDTIQSKGWKNDRIRISALLKQYETDRILVGLPRSMNGSLGTQAEKVQAFGTLLVQDGFQVRYWDERLTTVAANRALIEGGVRREKRRQFVDKLAAVGILQSFLDAGGWADERDNNMDGGKHVDENNMERDNIVELEDEDGQTVQFEHLMTIEHEGEAYVLLAPVEPTDDLGEDEVLILRIEDDKEGEETYVGVEDEALLEVIFQKYLELADADEEE